VSQGLIDKRLGSLELVSANLVNHLSTINFTDLTPLTMLPYAIGNDPQFGRHLITIGVGSFHVQ
jgi:hypothetical protein